MYRKINRLGCAIWLLGCSLLLSGALVAGTPVFINELHYDNFGTDADEKMEIAGPEGVDLSGWALVLYNGNGGVSYATIPLSGILPDSCSGLGVLEFPQTIIQNGSPDGLALIDDTGTVVQFLSYEGSFTAADGPAVGMLSDDIGVVELSDTPLGYSLQLSGTGRYYQDFTWQAAAPHTFGACNTGQVFSGTGIGDLLINEIHADPDFLLGDANGDGVRDSSADEFVEIVNVSGQLIDLSGWTLSDSALVRHVFPAGSLVPNLCNLVVFGGGSPTGIFGNSLVQTASSGLLGLSNNGDNVILHNGLVTIGSITYFDDAADNQSLTRSPDLTGPFIKHSLAAGSGGSLYSPGTKLDGSYFSGCSLPPILLKIHQIQGAGLASPYAGTLVTTEDNLVTGVGPDGFTLQTPDIHSDSDPDTSEGIFVYTGTAPAVSMGDQVDVTGQVQEYFGHTEINDAPLVQIDSSGHALPVPVTLDEVTPSPSQPQSPTEFERFEGMRVTLSNGVICGPNNITLVTLWPN